MPAATKNPTEIKLNTFKNENDCHTITPKNDSKVPKYEEGECEEIFESEEEMKRSLARFCRGDFYLIGRIWIAAMKTVLVGEKFCLISKIDAACVHAATLTEPKPKKPPDMKYTELPVYECPHKNYKDVLEDKNGCPQSQKKILHCLLLPYVKRYRKKAQRFFCETKREFNSARQEIGCDFKRAKMGAVDYLRDPNNVEVRTGLVALGAGLGYYFGSGKGLPRKVIWTCFGAAIPGMICFPKETDETIRNVCWNTAQAWLAFCKVVVSRDCCGDLREKVPCHPTEPSPPPPPPAPTLQMCPKKV